MKKTIRCGVWVRYAGSDEAMKAIWGDMMYKVIRRSGDIVMGCFPCRYADGSIHLMSYGVRVSDLVIAR